MAFDVIPDIPHPKQKRLADDLVVMQPYTEETPCASFNEPSIPGLFIVLPKAKSIGDSKELGCAQFRLHFLCEFSSQTKDLEGAVQAIHSANHPGYELSDPSDFFDKYGSYLLTIMTIVRFGFKAKGLVVPPLTLTTGVGTSQDHLSHLGKNSLIDLTIRHIKITTGHVGSSTNERMLGLLELDQVKQHLKIENGEGVSGGLIQTIAQDGLCTWMCDEHQRQNHESAMELLEEAVTLGGGRCSTNAGDVKIRLRPGL
jgi:hypothetical protein